MDGRTSIQTASVAATIGYLLGWTGQARESAMQARGVNAVIEWDGDTVRARGVNGPAHRKLAGKDRVHEGDVVVPRNRVERAYHRPATRWVNGVLGIRTTDDRTYEVTFRAKQAEPFSRIARDLGA
jgi:hypothetical protein